MLKDASQKNFVISIGLIMGFIFLASFVALYAERHFTPSCVCIFPPWIFIILSGSLGVFVGTLTYYFITKHHIAEKKEIRLGVKHLLNFLDSDDKKIIKTLLDNSANLSQSKLSELSGLDKVKLSRRIDVMVTKEILKKEKNGMTNKIILDDSIVELFRRAK